MYVYIPHFYQNVWCIYNPHPSSPPLEFYLSFLFDEFMYIFLFNFIDLFSLPLAFSQWRAGVVLEGAAEHQSSFVHIISTS